MFRILKYINNKKIKVMKTIAQQLNIKEFPFEIKDNNGDIIYYEDIDGIWFKYEYDQNNNIIYFEDNKGFWYKQEYDSNNNEIYYENSEGYVKDERPKPIPEYTMEQLQQMLGKEFKIKK